jgi:hypothetical protein
MWSSRARAAFPDVTTSPWRICGVRRAPPSSSSCCSHDILYGHSDRPPNSGLHGFVDPSLSGSLHNAGQIQASTVYIAIYGSTSSPTRIWPHTVLTHYYTDSDLNTVSNIVSTGQRRRLFRNNLCFSATANVRRCPASSSPATQHRPTDRSESTMVVSLSSVPACTVHAQLQQRTAWPRRVPWR